MLHRTFCMHIQSEYDLQTLGSPYYIISRQLSRVQNVLLKAYFQLGEFVRAKRKQKFSNTIGR